MVSAATPPAIVFPAVGGAAPLWIVFDLNGTLASTSLVRHRVGGVIVRPNVIALLRLRQRAPLIRLAAWSSAAQHNVQRLVDTIAVRLPLLLAAATAAAAAAAAAALVVVVVVIIAAVVAAAAQYVW